MANLLSIARSKDFLAGAIFLLIGMGMVVEATNYSFGTLLRMGPGFFPTIIGALLGLVGAALIGKSAVKPMAEHLELAVRPAFFITVGLLAFAYSLPRFGLMIATALLVTLTRFAFRPPRLLGGLVLSAVLVVLAVVIFSYFLQLPIKLWP